MEKEEWLRSQRKSYRSKGKKKKKGENIRQSENNYTVVRFPKKEIGKKNREKQIIKKKKMLKNISQNSRTWVSRLKGSTIHTDSHWGTSSHNFRTWREESILQAFWEETDSVYEKDKNQNASDLSQQHQKLEDNRKMSSKLWKEIISNL